MDYGKLRIPMISDPQSEIAGQLSERSDAREGVLQGCPNWVKFFSSFFHVVFSAVGQPLSMWLGGTLELVPTASFSCFGGELTLNRLE